MTDQEIVQALRCCKLGVPCEKCPVVGDKDCFEEVNTAAAELIERLTAENADMRKEIEWKGMVIALAQRKQAEAEAERDALIEQIKERHDCIDCRHNDYCEFDDANVIDCMNCVQEECPCASCCDYSRWDWQGLPEAPEEIKAPLTEDAMINLAAQALGVEADRLREFAEADKDGRVVVLPCKVGKKIYYINGKYIIEVEVACYTVDETGAWLFAGETYNLETGGTYHCNLRTERIGKDIFLTREEAARAMQEMEGKKDGKT